MIRISNHSHITIRSASWAVIFFLITLCSHPAFLLRGATHTPPPSISLTDFKLIGSLSEGHADFTLTATAQVENSKGGSLEILSGPLALTELGPHPKFKLRAEQNRFILDFERGGKFPIRLKFSAAVRQSDGWNTVDFRVAPSTLEPILLQGLPAGTQFNFADAARPERVGPDFKSFLPSNGSFKLSWKESRPETEGKLFFSAEMLSQLSVSPGLMRQVSLLNGKVMQGEMNRVSLFLRGSGEVTRVQGEQVLAWNIEPVANSSDRRLVIQFNQPQKDQFTLLIQTQTPLGAFPQTAEATQLRPEGATRFAGYYRIVNDGAVRLEVAQATGLSQISPEQFPESDVTRAALRPTGNQRFVYRFSGGDTALRIQADQILPELAVSQLLAYHLAENELAIDGELELDIREAPLRELLIRIPKGYSIARLTAASLNDYFVSEPAAQADVELRLVFGQPISGRQIVQLRLERNKPLAETSWNLPRVEVAKAKSVRGHLAVAADAGFRLTAERTEALTEIATAFFPRKVPGIQAAFRISEPAWQAAVRVERLPQTVQVDALHLFSVGEGIAYGSSVLNYVVSGAPMPAFKVELSSEYFNVEFTGKDIRTWQKTEGGYIVQLHTPVSGSYTLLATYERPFKSQGETLTFTGARPLDAQTEQGHTLVISAYQFQVKPADVSAGLLPLETAEVPPEYRLFFDAPILAAYRYTSRPFDLKLALSPLAQGDSLNQVVDRASITNHISKEGQVLTDVRYFLKNRGNPHLRLTLPGDMTLWSATVNDAPVVPVLDAGVNLIPLPQRADPNAPLKIDLKLASRSKDPRRIRLSAPIVNAPVLLAEWKVEPDSGRRIVYSEGSLTPIGGVADVSGFAQLARVFTGENRTQAFTGLLIVLGMLAAALIVWRWGTATGVYKFSTRHRIAIVLGFCALLFAGLGLANLIEDVGQQKAYPSRDVTFLAPVQQANSVLTVEVANLSEKLSLFSIGVLAWPALLALVAWGVALTLARPGFRAAWWAVGWTLLGWAALRCPNGGQAFLLVLGAFLVFHVVIPAMRNLRRLPPQPEPAPAAPANAASATALLLLGSLLWFAVPGAQAQESMVQTLERPTLLAQAQAGEPQTKTGRSRAKVAESKPEPQKDPPRAESVTQEIRVEEKFALATARLRWDAERGEVLPLLLDPAVLTQLSYASNSLKLLPPGTNHAHQLLAQKSGRYEIFMRYELQVQKRESESGFTLPVPFGLVNRLTLTVANLDVDVISPQAVSLQRETSGSNTVASIVLSPSSAASISWRPRNRDVKREKPVFYAEMSHLYAPSAGVIEGAHAVFIRPAQGELSELVFTVPNGMTITDVADPGRLAAAKDKPSTALVSLWRFDPDARKLRITLSSPQSRPFTLVVRSQAAAGALPFEKTVGVLNLDAAANQIGLLGIATGSEVQLDDVTTDSLSPINLEDFPTDLGPLLQAQVPSLAARRAFRYADPKATATIKVSAVEPDIRVETQDTLSLGEDRTVLAANATVDITRAGIFRLSFVMPAGFDVESITGQVLSHWTEAKTDEGRVITLHLVGKTEGQRQFAISLAGPGVKATNAWPVPQLVLREANKQRGTLVVVPEQGLRLQLAASDGLTQLDPQKSGIKQKGVLAFRVLQTPHSLSLNIERVDSWIQVASLQHAIVNEAMIKVSANLQYQIENTGLKAFRVYLPTNAESVRFQGDQVADFLAATGVVNTNGLQAWDIKLHRRVIGSYLLQVFYQTPTPDKAPEILLRGLQAADVNLQRGFVTIQSVGRLQVRVDSPPTALQATEWQSIPRSLQQGIQATAANFAYRLVEPSFQLPLKVDRHEAARLLDARINNITFTSVISDDGVMLTQARLEMVPGDKRLLKLTLPSDARFWFAFVNQNGVWPWREQDRILIPLEQPARRDKVIPVEIFFSSRIGAAASQSLDLELLAPKFDLPLENITWHVSLSEKWKVKKWSGTLQLEETTPVQPAAVDVLAYLQNEASQQRERTKEAEEFLASGNNALQQGDPQEARRSFQAAYGLSAHDAAFNEDARVQLHNIKLQEALVGLNVRQAASGGDAGILGNKFRDLRYRKELNYTQQDAKDIIDRNSADDNASFMRLAERLIQQQDAAVTSPAALRANIPTQGRVLTFTRAVAVVPWADLHIGLKATAVKAASRSVRILILGATFVLLAGFGLASRRTTADAKVQ